mmetsp:Transcript_9808/g.31176  ORF Transcript_9808/g.31176 Transcript_9808/m.31176 type:complete len:274 (-) Transcript_9808:55-876(-)
MRGQGRGCHEHAGAERQRRRGACLRHDAGERPEQLRRIQRLRAHGPVHRLLRLRGRGQGRGQACGGLRHEDVRLRPVHPHGEDCGDGRNACGHRGGPLRAPVRVAARAPHARDQGVHQQGPALQDAQGRHAHQHRATGGRARGGTPGAGEGAAGLLLPLRRGPQERGGDQGGGRRQVHEARDLHEEEDGRPDPGSQQQRRRGRREPDSRLLREGRRTLQAEGVRRGAALHGMCACAKWLLAALVVPAPRQWSCRGAEARVSAVPKASDFRSAP